MLISVALVLALSKTTVTLRDHRYGAIVHRAVCLFYVLSFAGTHARTHGWLSWPGWLVTYPDGLPMELLITIAYTSEVRTTEISEQLNRVEQSD